MGVIIPRWQGLGLESLIEANKDLNTKNIELPYRPFIRLKNERKTPAEDMAFMAIDVLDR